MQELEFRSKLDPSNIFLPADSTPAPWPLSSSGNEEILNVSLVHRNSRKEALQVKKLVTLRHNNYIALSSFTRALSSCKPSHLKSTRIVTVETHVRCTDCYIHSTSPAKYKSAFASWERILIVAQTQVLDTLTQALESAGLGSWSSKYLRIQLCL